MDRNFGILRKISNYNQEPAPDLLVFGYQCKIFRDDEKALFIDQQKHLISHCSDEELKIDRFDVRGALHDLQTYEPPPGGYGNRLDYLTPSERKAEELCEEERYYSLIKNEVEEELYKEEESKRTSSSNYAEVAFSYDEIGPKEPTNEEVLNQTNSNDADEPEFVPSESLNLPKDIEVPKTQKHHSIIEKTAKFIASHGLQMEILLKTKQANNSQFDFLNHNGKYNQYYKFILDLMKNNNYPVSEPNEVKSEENSQTSEDFYNQTQKFETEIAIKVPVISYKPSADCAYTQLISKITGASISAIEQKQSSVVSSSSSPVNGTAEVKKISSGLLGLAQHYNSSSESENDDEDDNANSSAAQTPTSLSVYDGPFPPEHLQLIIDKTAAYVAKNGSDFEETLRAKQDSRFMFLNESNEFHLYYIFKVNQIKQPYNVKPTVIPSASKAVISKNHSKPKTDVKNAQEKIKVTPVSFSIKAKEENTVPLKTPVLVQEPSDDETEKSAKNGNSVGGINESMEELEKQLDIANDSNEKKEAKKAEERLKDKLAIAAREKLSMLTKEKQLQIERKKRALLFLDQIKGLNSNAPTNGDGKTITNEDSSNVINVDSDNESVYSIPSPPKDIVLLKNNSRSRSLSRSKSRTRTKSRSRSRSRSKSRRKRSNSRSPSRRRSKKSRKSHHSKKKSRCYSRSYSRSPSTSKYKSSSSRRRSRSRERSRHRSKY